MRMCPDPELRVTAKVSMHVVFGVGLSDGMWGTAFQWQAAGSKPHGKFGCPSTSALDQKHHQFILRLLLRLRVLIGLASWA